MDSRQKQSQAGELPCVLSVGFSKDLLTKRERLLKEAGFRVISTLSAEHALQSAKDGNYAGAVLGATLPNALRKEIASAIRHRNPNAVILMLYFDAIDQAELADAVLNVHTSGNAFQEVFRDLYLSRTGTRAREAVGE
jgi:DNA-binding NtrC family response regulator